jgi:hypothetical protein
MAIDAIGSSLSGIRSGFQRNNVAAENVANLLTEDFRPLRARQLEIEGGGSRVEVERASEPEPVDLAGELVGSSLAALQTKASLRVLDTNLDLIGQLVDTLG